MPGTITFNPSSGTGFTFEDKRTPVAGKDAWGVDTLTRAMWGAQPELVGFMAALDQGDTYVYDSRTWYLQTWDESDGDQVYPTVTLTYKGLAFGIPDPFITGRQIDLQGTFSCTSPSSATMTYSYTTQQTTYRYIKAQATPTTGNPYGRPTAPEYTDTDIDVDPVIYKSVVYNEDGTRLLGSVPAPLLTALTPVGYNIEARLVSCTPIIGTVWLECEDSVTRLLPGN